MFTQDISWVDMSRDEVEHNNLGCYRFACEVVCESEVSLLQHRVRNAAALYNGSVVPEEVSRSVYGYTQVTECLAHGDDLLDCGPC